MKLAIAIISILLLSYLKSVYAFSSSCGVEWTYLLHSKKCVKFSNDILSYPESLTTCISIYTNVSGSRLSDLNNWERNDLLIFNKTLSGVPLWTNQVHQRKDYTFGTINYKNFSIQNYIDSNQTKLFNYFCEADPVDALINPEEYHTVSSSNFIPRYSLGLLEYKAKYAGYNSVFSNGMFFGKGWCSEITAREKIFLEIRFYKRMLLKKINIQDGLFHRCQYWMTSFYIEYFDFLIGGWKNISKSDPPVFYHRNNRTPIELEFDDVVPSRYLRIYPLSANSNCPYTQFKSNVSIVCLRIELRGNPFKFGFNGNSLFREVSSSFLIFIDLKFALFVLPRM